MGKRRDPFSRNVFVNCPFDAEYLPLLRPLLFTIMYVGFVPRIASERSDSGENRVDKICALIRECRYSIHDLSRLRASEAGELSRMNMPFELGIEYGCRLFGTEPFQSKKCLVLEKDQHEFQKAISDLSGIDIKRHKNEPAEVTRCVRNWFVETVGLRGIDSATRIWYRFADFASDFYDKRVADGYVTDDLDAMPIPEYIDFIRHWLRPRKTRSLASR
ncbi:MAG TPA: hypothetical protein VF883_10100 [Thermoanaerobaculia bacterium]|jgi:hypothetical protein